MNVLNASYWLALKDLTTNTSMQDQLVNDAGKKKVAA
jgi:hypothetical protein